MRLDERTPDGRMILAEGFGMRELPLSIMAQFETGGGHSGATLVGRLDAIRVVGSNVEGWGWFLDTPEGQKAYVGVASGALRGNSVDLADVKLKVRYVFGEDDDPGDMEAWFEPMDVEVNFTKANIAATTLVNTPAFAEASAVALDEDEDLIASLFVTELNVPTPAEVELTAGAMVKVPHEAFFIEETETLCPQTVTDDGFVFGHLADRESCHTGWTDRCVRVPHSASNYALFNVSPVPTTEGRVRTGPIFLLGGHEATAEAINKAVADVDNAWADVRVTEGRLGPWMSGYVRPGTSPEKVYAAQASRVSGHWKREGGDLELYAIASVNAAGFSVPWREVEMDDEGVNYLAASFIPCQPPVDRDLLAAVAVELILDEEDDDAA